MRMIVAAALAVTLAGPALARHDIDKKVQDPNRVICRTEEVVGSRLATNKRCLTAYQWDQEQRETRNTVERVQEFKPNNGN